MKEWISVAHRLPTLKEINKDHNWKFLVCNNKDQWVDSAYFNVAGQWHNGECEIIPTHWMLLPNPPQS